MEGEVVFDITKYKTTKDVKKAKQDIVYRGGMIINRQCFLIYFIYMFLLARFYII